MVVMAGKNSEKIAVLPFSPSSLVREMIISVLESDHDINVIGEASNRSELMDYLNDHNPDIVIIHNQLNNNMYTLEAVRLINELAGGVKPMVLFEDYDKDFELAVLEAGVRGFLPERRVKSDIIRCIKAVKDGQMWVRREVMGEFVTQLFVKIRRGDYLSPSVHYFTKRELEVIILVNKGYKNKEIAKMLFISEKTVKHHLSKVFKKLKIKKRTEIKQYF
jgi:two-component system, NarL family, response regulator DegU